MIDEVVPPQSLEMEQAVIGSMLVEQEAVDRCFDIVSESDFIMDRHKVIVGAIHELYVARRPVDLLTLSEVLKDKNIYEEVGGGAYLKQCIEGVEFVVNAGTYAAKVLELSKRRKIMDACMKTYKAASNCDLKIEKLENGAVTLLNRAIEGKGTLGIVDAMTSMLRTSDRLEEIMMNPEKSIGLSTGISYLDGMLQGLRGSRLIVVAAQPGVGKSALCLDIFKNIVLKYKHGASIFFSLEMPEFDVDVRLIANLARLDSRVITSGHVLRSNPEIWNQITKACSELSESTMYKSDMQGVNVASIRNVIKERLKKGPVKSIFIDFLQRMDPEAGKFFSTHERITETMKRLKDMSNEFDIPVIIPTQLNRGVNDRADRRPEMTDSKESSSIEEQADTWIGLYRADRNKPDNEIDHNAEWVPMELLVRKNRDGPTGTVYVKNYLAQTRFEEMESHEHEQYLTSERGAKPFTRRTGKQEPVPPPEAPDRFAPESPMKGWGEK